MKKIIYILMMSILLSCNKSEEPNLDSSVYNPKISDDFFDNDVNDSYLEYAITFLKTENSEKDFINEIITKYGQPLWDLHDTYNDGDIIDFTVPIVKSEDVKVNYLYVFQLQNGVIHSTIICRDSDKVALNGENWRFDYFTQVVFGVQDSILFKVREFKEKGAQGDVQHSMRYGEYESCYDSRVEVTAGGYTHTYYEEICKSRWGFKWVDDNPFQHKAELPDPTRGGGGGGGSNHGNHEPLPPITETDIFNESLAGCIKKLLTTAGYGSTSIMDRLLKGFDSNTSSIDVTFKLGDLTGANGKTKYDSNTKKMDIIIDNDRLNASGLKLARTILHECFHAYIFGKLKEAGLHKGIAPEPDWKSDYKLYKDFYYPKDEGNDAGDVQHNLMADKYRKFIKQGLYDYWNKQNNIDRYTSYVEDSFPDFELDDLFEALTWEGLKQTDAWGDLESNDPAKYNKIIKLLSKKNPDGTLNQILSLLPKQPRC